MLLECLDAAHRLEVERAPATTAGLGRRLALGPEAVTERVMALQGLGLVALDSAGRLAVTPEGQRIGRALLRRHRLLERFLFDTLKLPWERVHEQAARLTPVLADDVADALAAFLGSPATCPHGNPIPTGDEGAAPDRGVPLHRLAPGRRATILRIEREEPEMLRYLAALGLLPHTEVEVEEVAPLGGPVLVRVGASRYALGRKVAARIVVREA